MLTPDELYYLFLAYVHDFRKNWYMCPCELWRFMKLVSFETHCNIVLQESLANAKVNARQHSVSLSCIGDEDSENIASERYENRHLRRPLSCLTPHIFRTPANICITLILLETTFTGLHFRCWHYGFICIRLTVVASQTRNHAKFRENSTLQQFKVIDLGVNGKPICDFLLVFNSNFSRIWYRFRDIDA